MSNTYKFNGRENYLACKVKPRLVKPEDRVF